MQKITIYLPNGKTKIHQEGKNNVESIDFESETGLITVDFKDGKRLSYHGMPFISETVFQ